MELYGWKTGSVYSDWVEQYIGIPFKERGRGRDGCDCYGLCRLIWKEQFGLELPDYLTTYESAKSGKEVQATLTDNCLHNPEWNLIPYGKERLGDVAFMKGYYKVEGKWMAADMHVGLILAPGFLIHTESGIDSSIANYHQRLFKNRIVNFYRHERLLDGSLSA